MQTTKAKHDPDQIEVTLLANELKNVPSGVKSVSLWFDQAGRWLGTARANSTTKRADAVVLGAEVMVEALSLAATAVSDYLKPEQPPQHQVATLPELVDLRAFEGQPRPRRKRPHGKDSDTNIPSE